MVGLRRGRATVVRRNPGDYSRTGRGGRRPLRPDRVPLSQTRLAPASNPSSGRELHRHRGSPDRACGGHSFDLQTGGAATVPMGVPHTFRVDSETARVLVLSTPAGLERVVRGGGFPAAPPPLPPADAPRRTAEELAQVFHAHGQINVGPPLTPDD